MQNAIDTKAHLALCATRLNMDIAGALIKGVLQQPINDIHNVLVVGFRVFGAAQF